jgi:antitoxin component YwqK of YwqJK toxin-antitoxin module
MRAVAGALALGLGLGPAAAHTCPAGSEHVEGMEHTESSRTAHWCVAGDKANGPYEVYGPRLEVRGEYVGGKRDGLWTEWYDSGVRKTERRWSAGTLDGLDVAYDPRGRVERETMWVAGKRHGNHAEYAGRVQVVAGEYRDGARHGTWTFWSTRGRRLGANTIVDGGGTWTEWHPNGRKREQGELVDDARAGAWTEWYASGARMLDEQWHAGVRHGAFTQWYESGETLRTGAYLDGLQHGVWRVWYDTGELQGVYEYDRGRTVHWREWRRNGRLLGHG